MRKLLLVSAAALALACDTPTANKPRPEASPSPTPLTPAQELAMDEILFQEDEDSPVIRAEARQVGKEFVHGSLPGWEVKGVRSEPNNANVFKVAIDIERGKSRETVDLYVEKFFPDKGEPYWKARIMSKALMDVLHESEDIKRLRRLNELKVEGSSK